MIRDWDEQEYQMIAKGATLKISAENIRWIQVNTKEMENRLNKGDKKPKKSQMQMAQSVDIKVQETINAIREVNDIMDGQTELRDPLSKTEITSDKYKAQKLHAMLKLINISVK